MTVRMVVAGLAAVWAVSGVIVAAARRFDHDAIEEVWR